MALLQQVPDFDPAANEPIAGALTAPRIRRCTFRRLSRVPVGPTLVYEVSCLYPDRQLPLPLGDMDSGLSICAACSASHIFRPDED